MMCCMEGLCRSKVPVIPCCRWVCRRQARVLLKGASPCIHPLLGSRSPVLRPARLCAVGPSPSWRIYRADARPPPTTMFNSSFPSQFPTACPNLHLPSLEQVAHWPRFCSVRSLPVGHRFRLCAGRADSLRCTARHMYGSAGQVQWLWVTNKRIRVHVRSTFPYIQPRPWGTWMPRVSAPLRRDVRPARLLTNPIVAPVRLIQVCIYNKSSCYSIQCPNSHCISPMPGAGVPAARRGEARARGEVCRHIQSRSRRRRAGTRAGASAARAARTYHINTHT